MCWFMCMLIRNSLKPRVLRATCEFHFWMPNSMRTKFYLNFIKITINFIFSNCLHNLSKHLALALQPSVSFIIFILFLAVFRERSFYFNLVIYISIYNGYGRGWMCRNVMCLWTLESSRICFMHTMNARLNRWHLNRKFFFLLFFWFVHCFALYCMLFSLHRTSLYYSVFRYFWRSKFYCFNSPTKRNCKLNARHQETVQNN